MTYRPKPRPGPESRLPEPIRLAALVNEHGTGHVARTYRVTQDAVWMRLRRAGYRADVIGSKHAKYVWTGETR